MTGSLPPQCLLYVDGVRFADGSAGYDTDPVALDDLVVTWGRATILDQPAPASCSFRVLDLPGGPSFRELLYVGARVDVLASTVIYPDPTLGSFADPGFESGSFGGTAAGAAAAVVTTAPHSGARCLQITPLAGARNVTVTIPPKGFSSNPVAWDAVPRAQAGQTWQLTAWVKLPQLLLTGSQTAYVQAVAFTHPDGRAPAALLPRVKVTGGAGTWQHITIPAVIAPVDSWLGVLLTVNPTGPAWDDVPAGTTWDALDATAWDDVGRVFVDDVDVLAPAAGALRQGAVFGGRVTDLDAGYDTDAGGTVVDVIAQSNLAELANRYVGDTPWPAQTAAARVAAVIEAAAQPNLVATVDVGVRLRPLCYLDVDAQPAAGLLAAVAQSVGGALWAPTSVAAQTALRIEDVDARPAMLRLAPTTVDTNLFTRPSFEDGLTTSFSPTGCTLTVITTAQPATPAAGTKLLRATATGTAMLDIGMANAIKPAATLGRLYRVSVYVRAGQSPAAGSGQLLAEYRDAGNVLVPGTQVVGTPVPLLPGAGGWQRLAVTLAAAPAAAVTLTFNLRVPAGTGQAAGSLVDWDAIMVHEVTADADPTLPYFDGDTPAAADLFYGWTGAQWSSTSTRSGPLTVTPAVTVAGGIELDACLLLLDPVRWDQDSTDTATQVAVQWQEQTAAGPPPTLTARESTRTDDVLTESRGRFRVSISTDLATQAAADALADTMLARLSAGGWRVNGLTWQIDAADVLDGPALTRVMRVLDATTRIGLPVLVTNLPEWAPIAPDTRVPLYLEGGRFSNTAGAWRLELATSSAVAQGKAAVAWDAQPAAWTWDQYDPAVTWDSLAGVGL